MLHLPRESAQMRTSFGRTAWRACALRVLCASRASYMTYHKAIKATKQARAGGARICTHVCAMHGMGRDERNTCSVHYVARSCLIDASRSLHAAAILSRFYPHGMKARSQSIDPYITLRSALAAQMAASAWATGTAAAPPPVWVRSMRASLLRTHFSLE